MSSQMETDDSMYKKFSLLYKLHQSLMMMMMMMMSPFLLIRFISKPNPSLIHTHSHARTHTHTHTHGEACTTVADTPDVATQHALHITHSREENKKKQLYPH